MMGWISLVGFVSATRFEIVVDDYVVIVAVRCCHIAIDTVRNHGPIDAVVLATATEML